MAASISIARPVLFESLRVRLSLSIDDFDSPPPTDRKPPGVRLEGPDIAVSGRQILLKPLT